MSSETKRVALGRVESASTDGRFVATFATLNVVDHHGDVTLPGAFDVGRAIAVGGYQHDTTRLPSGRAVLRSDATRAWIEGQFNLRSQIGRETYQTVKELQDVLEWSFIFQVLDWEVGDFRTPTGTVRVRFLKKLDVWSVDPVLRGAGINTRTDRIKGSEAPIASRDALRLFMHYQHALAVASGVPLG